MKKSMDDRHTQTHGRFTETFGQSQMSFSMRKSKCMWKDGAKLF